MVHCWYGNQHRNYYHGIVVYTTGFGVETYSVSSGVGYDKGYAKFGADFYNYVSNNAAKAASGASVAADNIGELIQLIQHVCGCAMICWGLLSTCKFGLKLSTIKREEEKAKNTEVVSAIEENPGILNSTTQSVSDI